MLLGLEQTLNRVMDWVGKLASAMLIVLVLIVAYNVISRYAFSASSIGLEELSWHLYAAIFLLGIPFALKSGSHVRVDLLYENFTPKTQATIDLVGCTLFLIPTCLIIIWSGWNFTAAAYGLGELPTNFSGFFQQLVSNGIGEKSQDPGGLLNRWIIKGVIPLSFVFLLLASIAFFIQKLNQFLGLSETTPESGGTGIS
jgi:TRAP-type mannitol/chloroaromatic compound transport system permease small subunit